MAALGWLLNLDFAGSGGASIAISGTATTGISETDVGGSKTIIGVVTGDTLVATFGDDNAITSAFLAGISSDLSESTGWNAVVRDTLTHANVVRDSDTQFTVTLEATYPTYDITADETITVTVPATSLTAAVGVVGSPAFGISAAPAVVTTGAGGGWRHYRGGESERERKERVRTERLAMGIVSEPKREVITGVVARGKPVVLDTSELERTIAVLENMEQERIARRKKAAALLLLTI